jgi:hypothetical protein
MIGVGVEVGVAVGGGWEAVGELVGDGCAVNVGSGASELTAWQAIKTIKAKSRKRRTT